MPTDPQKFARSVVRLTRRLRHDADADHVLREATAIPDRPATS